MSVNGVIWHVLEVFVVPDVQRMDNAFGFLTNYKFVYPVDRLASFVNTGKLFIPHYPPFEQLAIHRKQLGVKFCFFSHLHSDW